MAAMRPKHVATNHSFVALKFVSFPIVVYDVNIYIYTYNVTQRDGFRKVLSSILLLISCMHNPCDFVRHLFVNQIIGYAKLSIRVLKFISVGRYVM